MKSKQVLALIAMLLGIIGGIFLLVDFLETIPRILDGRAHVGVESIIIVGIAVIAIIASVIIWRGSYFAGGVINIVIGAIAIIYGIRSEGVLILISGILGVVAPQVKD
jgi:hypothetical protein